MNYKPFQAIPGVQYMQEEVLLFNNRGHLVNHLNYLFRSDQNQKWTNIYTSDCSFSFYAPNGWITKSLSSDLEIRMNWKQSLYNMLIYQLGQDAYSHLVMGVTYLYNMKNKPVHINASSILELTRVFSQETLYEFENLQPLLYICHADQGEATHIHRLYLNKEQS